jgi:hypothetical protein
MVFLVETDVYGTLPICYKTNLHPEVAASRFTLHIRIEHLHWSFVNLKAAPPTTIAFQMAS